MYKLVWKTQSSNAAQDEQYKTLHEAIKAFQEAKRGLHVHGGGFVAILEEDFFESGAQALVRWEEHISGGFGSGTAWYDVNPAENLGLTCENEGCCWNVKEESQDMCEDCEQASLDMVLAYLAGGSK
jgi:hypothetical protein